MFLARILFFRLHESPRYLVHAGRPQEALESLQLISRFNGSDLTIDLDDVDDQRPAEPQPPSSGSDEREPFLPSSQESRSTRETDGNATSNSAPSDPSTRDEGVKDYQSTSDSPNSLDSHLFVSPVEEYPPQRLPSSSRTDASHDETKRRSRFSDAHHHRTRSRSSRRSSMASVELEKRCGGVLPRWIKRPLIAWLDRVSIVLSPEWYRTTLLVWAIWFFMSLGMSYAVQELSTSPNHRHQPTRCSTCTIPNCWRRESRAMRPRNRSKITYGTLSSLRWLGARALSYVIVPIFTRETFG